MFTWPSDVTCGVTSSAIGTDRVRQVASTSPVLGSVLISRTGTSVPMLIVAVWLSSVSVLGLASTREFPRV